MNGVCFITSFLLDGKMAKNGVKISDEMERFMHIGTSLARLLNNLEMIETLDEVLENEKKLKEEMMSKDIGKTFYSVLSILVLHDCRVMTFRSRRLQCG